MVHSWCFCSDLVWEWNCSDSLCRWRPLHSVSPAPVLRFSGSPLRSEYVYSRCCSVSLVVPTVRRSCPSFIKISPHAQTKTPPPPREAKGKAQPAEKCRNQHTRTLQFPMLLTDRFQVPPDPRLASQQLVSTNPHIPPPLRSTTPGSLTQSTSGRWRLRSLSRSGSCFRWLPKCECELQM